MPIDLILAVTPSYAGSVGFGDIYTCAVHRVLAGALADRSIQLSVLASDDALGRAVAEGAGQETEVGFTLHERDAPYAMLPISGFVAEDRTAWEIAYVRSG